MRDGGFGDASRPARLLHWRATDEPLDALGNVASSQRILRGAAREAKLY